MSESDFRTDDAREEAEMAATADESATADADTDQVEEDALRRADELTVDPEVRESYQEAAERGANLEGEGRIP